MFATVAADGRAHNFGQICKREMDAELRQLAYLVGADCVEAITAEWAEGVQLSRIGAETRIVVSGNTATVFDGAAPDRALYADGRWEIAEPLRNRRFDKPNEAQEAAAKVNRLLREHHQPELGSETSPR